MFGESESESPRVPSPWDNIISTPPSPATKPVGNGGLVPKLVPEAEEGNVEYKLQLLSPSPSRFLKLVTQLKWRLLEGGGQAYYELGVADSGELIGLRRKEMEDTLGTLEEMAGEIGASVIVVKEIEVTGFVGEGGAGRWSGGTRKIGDSDESGTTDADTTDVTDTEDDLFTPDVFAMAPEVDTAVDSGIERTASTFSLDLEIASVFKPRPRRKRAHEQAMGVTSGKRKEKDWTEKTGGKKHTYRNEEDKEEKLAMRRVKRDRMREERMRALEGHAGLGASHMSDGGGEADKLAESLSELHVDVQRSTVEQRMEEERVPITVIPPPDAEEAVERKIMRALDDEILTPVDDIAIDRDNLAPPATPSDRGDLLSSTQSVTQDDMEPRLIVEALVVRKMSLEEAYLDFGGFTLV